MKKLKNIFLLGFLICLSIFIGINISFFAYSYNADFTYNLVTSDVQDNGMKIEKNYFKSKYFNQKVMNSILTNLKYSVIDSENEDKYSSNDAAMGSYYYDYNEDIYYYDDEEDLNMTERELAENLKAESKKILTEVRGIDYFIINNSTGETVTNTDYKTLSNFKENAKGYYQAQFENNNLVNRKIGNTEYKPISGYFYYPENSIINVNDDIDAYVSISKKLIDFHVFEYGYSTYQQIVNKYEKSLEWGIPAGILSVIFFVIYMIMNFKLPKTKREFWNYYNKIPLEVIVTVLSIDIALIVAIAEEPNPFVNQFCIIPIFILLFYFILIVKQISNFERKRDFFKTSWAVRIIIWIFKKMKVAMQENRNLIKQNKDFDLIKKIITVAVLCVLAEFIFIIMSGGWIDFLALIVIFGIQLGFLIYFVKKLGYLNDIMKGVHKIKEGELNYKIEEKNDIYFSSLANDINNISEGLENSIEQRIKSERMKSELITNVSHDLKTPLTSIINYIELIKKEEDLSPAYLKDYVKVLDNKSKRLKVLIEDLFEASKASTGNIELDLVKLDLKQLLQQSIGELEDKLEEANLSLRVNLTEEDTYVLADGRRLYRVFENLLCNISKYSLENTRVYIDVIKEDGKIITTMKNISSYELNFDPDEIMERFKRADESRNTEGSGLGLAIARDLVSLQGGNMSIEIDGDLFKVKVVMDEYSQQISLQK
ncbi:MAG: sensor histidine kinase [Intestinibacter bartlettii]|uniref:sensor histidine kinase n=1 Tax=Intestinibacter bartlettii TaxID=261299 RepID=UPI0026E9B270|nr:sensor histidine kinase [Intestinibacter bartlettii]MDO5010752.1 sensor histidine kinase [Intestinibacter bartlettii]